MVLSHPRFFVVVSSGDCVCVWLVFILTGTVPVARARYRLINVGGTAVTPDTRPLVPLDGSPWLFRFFFYICHRSHARAFSRTHSRTRFVECVVRRIRRTVLYTYVHVNARIPLRVCECVAFSFLFLAVRSAAVGLHNSHDHRHSVVCSIVV